MSEEEMGMGMVRGEDELAGRGGKPQADGEGQEESVLLQPV